MPIKQRRSRMETRRNQDMKQTNTKTLAREVRHLLRRNSSPQRLYALHANVLPLRVKRRERP